MKRCPRWTGGFSLLAVLLFTACTSSGDAVTFAGDQLGMAHVTVYFGKETDEENVSKLIDSRFSGLFGWRFLTRQGELDRVEVEIQPADVVHDMTDNFDKTMILPVGLQTFTARAYYDTDDGEVLAGEGTAQATIVVNQTTDVQVTILDLTGPVDGPTHAPIISSLTASNTSPVIDETINLEVVALDPNEDELTYSWSDDCGGSFTAADQAQTDWSNDQSIICELKVTVSDGTFEAEGTVGVTVYQDNTPQGTTELNLDYQENPYIYAFTMGNTCQLNWNPNWISCTIDGQYTIGQECRAFQNATCAQPAVPGHVYGYTSFVVQYLDRNADSSDTTATLTDNCGGTSTYLGDESGELFWFNWQAPNETGLCMLTATIEQYGMTDSIDIAVLVAEE